MTAQLKPGDIVRLKSGGPKMTVRGYYSSRGGWVCNWFIGEEIRESAFSEQQLEIVD